jgi:hypothetical protein
MPELPTDWRTSLHDLLVFNVRDWGQDSADAWLYGVIVGWDGPAMKELAEKHRWSSETVARLRRLRALYIREVPKDHGLRSLPGG